MLGRHLRVEPAGQLKTTTLPGSNGYVETRAYDRAGRLTEVKHAQGTSVLARSTYTLDEVGNPLRIDTPGGSTSYRYDPRDRLTDACYATSCPALPARGDLAYDYDALSNRTAEIKAGSTTTYDYNSDDELVSSTGGGTTTTYAHDANGNMTRAGTRAFTYDLVGRMSSTTTGSATTRYSYDGLGKRLKASSGSEPSDKTNYLWDPNSALPQLALERDGAGNPLRSYAHGNDLLSMSTPSGSYFFHHDGLGSVTDVTSASGAPQWDYTYEAYGSPRATTKVDPAAPANPMRFTGEYLDPTGLYHLRARQYEPGLGRFTAVDPWQQYVRDAYTSPHVYVAARPTVLVDPNGMLSIFGLDVDVGDVLGFVGTAASAIALTATVIVASGAVIATLPVSITVAGASTRQAGLLERQQWCRGERVWAILHIQA